jgi:membrane-bound lytic murein transglycosylase D
VPSPPLLGPVLGLRAFGQRAAEARAAAPQAPERALLGLSARAARARSIDAAPGAREMAIARAVPEPVRPAHDPPPRARGRRPKASFAGRAFAAIVAAGLAVCGATGWLVWRSSRTPGPATTVASVAVAPAPAPQTLESTLRAPRAFAAPLTALAIHSDRPLTPELGALIDIEGQLAAACTSDPGSCARGWTLFSRASLVPVPDDGPASAPLADTATPAWLRRLTVPAGLPVRDTASLRAMFDFTTKNIAGRQRFQAELFECAAYEDIFDSTLVKYGAPPWLFAVVYQESACNPRAASPAGAKGLWQFMPESARAYGLRVEEGVIDERLNPIRSTEAAVHFLTDLQRALGAWDLVFAAYNMGPFGVATRLTQAGEGAGFWDLVRRKLLPEETASYVPAIEAYALALANLSHLQFSREGKRLESTAEISVHPAMRLSLLARAASTTAIHIRELNREFLQDVVPEGQATARVPDAEAHRAQALLDTWSPDDNRDVCVPEDFDWGAKAFANSKYAKDCAASSAR